MNVELLPILPTLEENAHYLPQLDSQDVLELTVQYYARIGYSAPWIGYFACIDSKLVGSAGYKGRPIHGRVEIAYGTFPPFQHQGIGTQICRLLVEKALAADPQVIITARTLRKKSHSTRILEKNQFVKEKTVVDPEDGKVWEWRYTGMPMVFK